MCIISVDLGTTNIKVIAYDKSLKQLSEVSSNISYFKDGNTVEFDAEKYFEILIKLIMQCCEKSWASKPYPVKQIVLTGQAESLIMLDKNDTPVRNAISWLDMRSQTECEELKQIFDANTCYHITGQPEIIPTWPITKILWLKKNEPENYNKVNKYLLLKDYIQYRLCGILAGEYSIYNFSHYFDISKKEYWMNILDYCGVGMDQLPPLVEPCTVLGPITAKTAALLEMDTAAKVNTGTLDHFAGMIGTGNISEGVISETTGTVLAIATMIGQPLFSEAKVACHYGPFQNMYVLLPVCESGGISLEWFKKTFMPSISYEELNLELHKRKQPGKLVYLPYIAGTNAPDFNTSASSVFFGFKANHDQYDFALAIMEGVAQMLKKNIDHMETAGINANCIISTGGGAKSDLWSQMKADITNYTVAIPENEEAACLGAAIIAAVSEGFFGDFNDAVQKCVRIKKQFEPKIYQEYQTKNILAEQVYLDLQPAFKMHYNL